MQAKIPVRPEPSSPTPAPPEVDKVHNTVIFRGAKITLANLIKKRNELLEKCKDLISWKDVPLDGLPRDIAKIEMVHKMHTYNYTDQYQLKELQSPKSQKKRITLKDASDDF